jgi:phytoene synthase
VQSGDVSSRAETVAAAQRSIALGSKSFAAASRLFDRETRERAWLLYAWCRACDDIADGQDHGGDLTRVSDPHARLAEITAKTEAALAGNAVGDPPFDALRIVAAETGMPHRFARDLVAGFALDAEDWRPRSEGDLYRYCYHVAGVVGCMMAVVMGVSPNDDATLDRACDLGMAFQLANIARDIDEDDRGGRCYLPVDWLVEMDMPPGEHMKPPFRQRLAVLSRRLADRAAEFEESARYGAPALPFRSAWAVLSAAAIYGAIGRKVADGGEHAWDRRVTTSATEKLRFILRGYVEARGRAARYPPTPRVETLWTRPRG